MRKYLLFSVEIEQEGSKGKSIKPKIAKDNKMVHCGKKVASKSDDKDENCVYIYCLKPYNQS